MDVTRQVALSVDKTAEEATESPKSIVTAEDEAYMRLALRVAERALSLGEVPVGCVLVLDHPSEDTKASSVVVSHGANQVNATRDATRHAEMVAMDRVLTGGVSSDALRLPAAVMAQSAKGSVPKDSPLATGNAEQLQEIWQDKWVHAAADEGDNEWKRTYGWGTGRRLDKEDLARCRLYVSQDCGNIVVITLCSR